jgi:hypothetical protein
MAELDKDLTHKQAAFVDHYSSTGNATKSALEAGYSEKTAYSIGHENLKKPEIQAAIGEKMRESAERLGAGRDWRLSMLQKVAEASLSGAASKDAVVHPTGVIGAIAELNKMCGDYEITKQDSEPATIADVQEIMKQYKRDI